jgi:hypothetical protein
MGLLDKAKQAAEQAAAKAREGVEDVQAKRELAQAYNELGKTTFELIDRGELSDTRLDASAARVREALAKADSNSETTGANDDTPHDTSQPPAMPI